VSKDGLELPKITAAKKKDSQPPPPGSLPEFNFVYEKDKASQATTPENKSPKEGSAESSSTGQSQPQQSSSSNDLAEASDDEDNATLAGDKGKGREDQPPLTFAPSDAFTAGMLSFCSIPSRFFFLALKSNTVDGSGLRYRYTTTTTTTASSSSQPVPHQPPPSSAQLEPQPQARNPAPQAEAAPAADGVVTNPPQESLLKGAIDLLIFVIGSFFAYLVYRRYFM